MKISFKGVGQTIATFAAENSAAIGQVCKITQNGTVGPCAAGDQFCGSIVSLREGVAGVQLKGFATLSYSGAAPAPGWQALAADANGAVKSNEAGRQYLVAEVDTASKTVGLFL